MSTKDWKLISLNEALQSGEIQLGRGDIISSQDIANYPGQYPIYSSSAKGRGEFGRYGNFMFNEELITWSIDGGGKFFYRPAHKFSITNVCGYMKVDPSRWNLKFVYYLLDFQHRFINFDYQIKAHPSVIKKIYFLTQLSLPEQNKIATILSTIDCIIEQTEALIAKKQRIKTGLMQDLLTKGIDEKGNMRSEATHAFKDSSLGRIPVKWEVNKLGESCEVYNSFRKPIVSLVRENMKGDYPYYGPTGIIDHINEYQVDGKFVLIGEDGDHFLKFKSQEMTLLVEGKYNVNNHAHILQGKNNVLTEWIHLFYLHRDVTLYLTRQGAGRFKLNKAALLELPLLVPIDIVEQQNILKVMNAFRENQSANINNLNKLKLKETALMQDLLTGTVRVTELLNSSPTNT